MISQENVGRVVAKRKLKCVVNRRNNTRRNNTFRFCERLTERLDYTNSRIKGLSEVVLTNFVTNKTRTAGIVYKTELRDNGMMLNFCPFCGVQLMED